MNTPFLDVRRLGVLVFVDHVLVEGLGHQPLDIFISPSLAEGSEVLSRVAVQHELIVHHSVRVLWIVLMLGHFVLGHLQPKIG
jgi:hypothetical protein